jgi:hypothetical protein
MPNVAKFFAAIAGMGLALQEPMRPSVLALLGFSAGAIGGVGSSVALREAHADALGEVTVPVPEEGVVFRGNAGRPIVRIRSEAAGGSLEVLDGRGGVAVRLRATPTGGNVELGPSASVRPALRVVGTPGDPGY